jgi:hypothetical protein
VLAALPAAPDSRCDIVDPRKRLQTRAVGNEMSIMIHASSAMAF